MATGDFTKQEADATTEALNEIMKSMSKTKCLDFLGHFNDIFCFITAAKAAAPDKKPDAKPDKKPSKK